MTPKASKIDFLTGKYSTRKLASQKAESMFRCKVSVSSSGVFN